MISQLVEGAIPAPPNSIRPNVDRRLESICMKAIAKRPQDRFESAEAMANAFREYLANPVIASSLEADREVHRVPVSDKSSAKTSLVYGGILVAILIGTWRLFPWLVPESQKNSVIALGTDSKAQNIELASKSEIAPSDLLPIGNFGKSLKFDVGAYVEIDGLELDEQGSHTLEAFVTAGIPHDGRDKHVFGWPGPSSLFLRGPSSSWAFGLSHIVKYQFIQSPNAIEVGQRVHLAMVRDGFEHVVVSQWQTRGPNPGNATRTSHAGISIQTRHIKLTGNFCWAD